MIAKIFYTKSDFNKKEPWLLKKELWLQKMIVRGRCLMRLHRYRTGQPVVCYSKTGMLSKTNTFVEDKVCTFMGYEERWYPRTKRQAI